MFLNTLYPSFSQANVYITIAYQNISPVSPLKSLFSPRIQCSVPGCIYSSFLLVSPNLGLFPFLLFNLFIFCFVLFFMTLTLWKSAGQVFLQADLSLCLLFSHDQIGNMDWEKEYQSQVPFSCIVSLYQPDLLLVNKVSAVNLITQFFCSLHVFPL